MNTFINNWFNAEIMEEIIERNCLFKKFKNNLAFDKDGYKETNDEVQKLIFRKKKLYFEQKLTKTIANLRDYERT